MSCNHHHPSSFSMTQYARCRNQTLPQRFSSIRTLSQHTTLASWIKWHVSGQLRRECTCVHDLPTYICIPNTLQTNTTMLKSHRVAFSHAMQNAAKYSTNIRAMHHHSNVKNPCESYILPGVPGTPAPTTCPLGVVT